MSQSVTALTRLKDLTVARQIKGIYHTYDAVDSTRDHALEETSSSDGDCASQSDLESESLSENGCSDLDSESDMEVDGLTLVNGEDFHESYDENFFAVTSTGSYRFPSFLEFLMESQNADFVNEMVGREMRMWVCDDDTGVLPAVVQMCSSLDTVRCYGFSERMGAALSHKKHLTEFVVKMDSIDDDDFKDFQSILDVLQTCPKIGDLTIEVHFSESCADLAAGKLAEALQRVSLRRCDINAHDSLKDDAIAVLAPALSRLSGVILQCKEIRSLGLAGFAAAFSLSMSLTYLHITVQCFEGDDRTFFSSLKTAPSLRTLKLSCTGSDPPSITDTSAGRALISGNVKELSDILGLSSPPFVEKTLTIFIFDNFFAEVDFKYKLFMSVGPVCGQNIYHFYGKYKQIEIRKKMGHTEIETLSNILIQKEVEVRNLYLYTHTIGDKGAMLLGDALRRTLCIRVLIVRNCGIGVEGIVQLFAGLTRNTTLETLDASFNPFGDDGAAYVANLINSTSIKVLDISSCNVGEKGIVALASSLTTNKTLTRINLYSPVVISKDSEIELTKMLIQNCTLKVLDVNQNSGQIPLELNSFASYSMFKVSCISSCAVMKSTSTSDFYYGLKMSCISSIEIDSSTCLGQALWSFKMEEVMEILQLKQTPFKERNMNLCVSGNTWTVDYENRCIKEHDVGLMNVCNISNRSECCTQLRELNLGNQTLGSIGACLLAKLLNQTQLTHLNIACCGIGEEGIILLASALGTNTTIKHLAIGANQISKQGQNALIKSFSENTTLVSLDIASRGSIQSGRIKYITSFVEDEDDFFHRVDQLSSLTKVIFDSSTAFGRSLEEIYLQVNDQSCHHTIECQLKPIRVTKIYHRTNPSRVLYHCTA